MRKQIAAANWKMNLTIEKANSLLEDILKENIVPAANAQVLFAVPFPYLTIANEKVKGRQQLVPATWNLPSVVHSYQCK